MEKTTNNDLTIYIAYDRLSVKDFSLLLNNLAFISEKIIEDHYLRYESNSKDLDIPLLEIGTVNTGNSIKFTLIEGWKPTFSSNESFDLVVGVPKKLGVPIAIAYLLVHTANYYQDFHSKQLDIKVKELEIQLKEMELAKSLVSTSDAYNGQSITTEYYLNEKVPEIKPILMDTVKNILKNDNISVFKINDLPLKNSIK